jgi:pyocin large subunit-like protein
MQYDPPPRRGVMLTKQGHITVERLPNGLYRVYDARDKNTNSYNEDGTPRGTAVDAAESRAAVREAISRYKASMRLV